MRTAEDQADLKLLSRLVDRVGRRLGEVPFTSLTDAEQVLWVVWWLEADVNTGGFHKYFSSSEGDHARDAAEALRKIGAARCAEIVEAAVSVFPAPGPSRDRAKRERELERLSQDRSDRLEALTHRFYVYPDPLERLLAEFARRHATEFPGESAHWRSSN